VTHSDHSKDYYHLKVDQKPMGLSISGRHFIDENGRTVILRGINLAGISISKTPNGATHQRENWPPHDLKYVSWVDRPFPIKDAKEHFHRIKNWGFNCIRLLTSWEAIEHAGPYVYDLEYLEYFSQIAQMASDTGLYVFINFHQDVWSRVTGGDGHPLWLFEKVGLEYSKFDIADAANNMQAKWDPDPIKNQYEEMSWNQNDRLFPVKTMWTLFWAGKDFAPKTQLADEISGERVNIGDYMQRHYCAAINQVVKRVKNIPLIIGFNPINEPSTGYIGSLVTKRSLKVKEGGEPGIAWAPLDTMAVAAGIPREIEVLGIRLPKGLSPIRKIRVNPLGISLWLENRLDIWRDHGVWGIEHGEPVALQETYFQSINGRAVDFTADYLIPFHRRVASLLHHENPEWLVFVENDPRINGALKYTPWPNDMPANTVNASHWYDIIQLGLKRLIYPITLDLFKMRPVFGWRGIEKMYQRQLGEHLKLSMFVNGGNCPTLIGEFGISMDMDKKRAYRKWATVGQAAFAKHARILNAMYNAFDALLLSGAHWNYCADNCNKFGDQWNLEDLSLYSKNQMGDSQLDPIYQGARGIYGYCRPYAQRIAGQILTMKFDQRKNQFWLKFRPTSCGSSETEIFIPNLYYPAGIKVRGSGFRSIYLKSAQTLKIIHDLDKINQEIIVFVDNAVE
jgi:hypothetical protein